VEALERGDRTAHPAAARFVLRARDQLARLIGARADGAADPDEALLRAVASAFADRLARRRAAGSDRFVLRRGGARLEPSSAVRDAELVVAVEMAGGGPGGEARIRQASEVRREWLPGEEVECVTDLFFEGAGGRVAAVRRERYRGLVLAESPTALPEGGRVAEVLAAAAAERLPEALALDDPTVRSFLDRVACLHEWRPELGLPEIGEPEIRGLLPALAAGRRSFAELRKAPLLPFLAGLLSSAQRAALDREAPERIALPGGARLRLLYERGRPPVLAARIQQLFGLAQTPRVAGGRVPVLLHLLAPNGRPQQITEDLASFWQNVYPKVRKELRRRYPKHAWPESGVDA
jgi:ATP-dependent helicase HrpB